VIIKAIIDFSSFSFNPYPYILKVTRFYRPVNFSLKVLNMKAILLSAYAICGGIVWTSLTNYFACGRAAIKPGLRKTSRQSGY